MFISTISGWVLIGALCVVDLSDSLGQKCVNFWDSPMVYHKTLEECKKAANTKAQKIKNKMDENKIPILTMQISCFHTDPVKPDGSLEKGLDIHYNIL
jgi:hypothetical protein